MKKRFGNYRKRTASGIIEKNAEEVKTAEKEKPLKYSAQPGRGLAVLQRFLC